MKTFHAILSTVTNCLWWVGLFVAGRIAVWLADKPAWWTVPLALAAGIVWLGAGAAAHRARSCRAGAGMAADPGLKIRMAAAWKRGAGFLSRRFFKSPPPLYLFLDVTRNSAAPMLELLDAGDEDTADFGDEFTWHRGPDAVWIDYSESHVRNDGGRWNAFLGLAARARFSGVVVALDATRLAAGNMTDAAVLRSRLESLQESRSGGIPVYLVLDNIDRLYGLRSLASRLDPERLDSPFGDVRDAAAEKSPVFFRRVLGGGGELLESQCGGGGPQTQTPSLPGAAALLAPTELARLEAPLTRFCRQVFLKGREGRGGGTPWIRGLFLAASAPGGGGSMPAVLARLAGFAPAHEPFPVQPWFLRTLFREVVPADAEAAASVAGNGSGCFAGRPLARHAAAALASALVVSLFVTWSFLENRGVLLSARGRAAAPESADGLEEYRELATAVRARADGWTLPRFGMTQAENLAAELQKRYAESYFDLKTIPGIEHVQDAALAAVESGEPGRIGNALLLLAATREGIVQALDADSSGVSAGKTRFLRSLVESLRLASPEDIQQMETYFAWAGKQDWMPGTARKLSEFEKYILDNATGGDAGWLPEWVATLPGLRAVDTSRVWNVPLADESLSRVAPAWTREGYAVAKALLDAVAYDADDPAGAGWRARREELLGQYRAAALERWRVAAAVLWNKFRRRVADGDVRTLLAQAARGDDPASRFTALLRRHLLPMFRDDAGGGDNPDTAWLFLRESLELSRLDPEGGLVNRFVGAVREWGSDEGLDRLSRKFGIVKTGGGVTPGAPAGAEAMASAERWREALRRFGLAAESPEENFNMVRAHFRSSRNGTELSSFDPLMQAGREAATLHKYLRESAGSGAWDGLSPLAVYDYMRYLATRRAALHLDALWRESVYEPAHLAPGGDADRLARLAAEGGALERFLTGTASGFWQWDGDRLANAEWRRLSFMFDPAFLEFCRSALRETRPERPERLELPFRVLAVDVDAGAVERPVRVEFALATGGGEQVVEFQNFRIEETMVWEMDADAAVKMRVVFPSVTAAIDFGGAGGFRNFAAVFSLGEARFGAERFGEAGEALRRMGVSEIVVKARLENGEKVETFLKGDSFGLPRSVIVPGA